ncbi:MAG TPA: hypothetical protein DHV36_02130 [Desulfobacteraceae bacterium]|nr:hypothetical protein [Desulfobacteraceae bacterium]
MTQPGTDIICFECARLGLCIKAGVEIKTVSKDRRGFQKPGYHTLKGRNRMTNIRLVLEIVNIFAACSCSLSSCSKGSWMALFSKSLGAA